MLQLQWTESSHETNWWELLILEMLLWRVSKWAVITVIMRPPVIMSLSNIYFYPTLDIPLCILLSREFRGTEIQWFQIRYRFHFLFLTKTTNNNYMLWTLFHLDWLGIYFKFWILYSIMCVVCGTKVCSLQYWNSLLSNPN